MKQLLFVFSTICILLTSCYKDNSNTSVEKINPIVIDFNGDKTTEFRVFMFDSLRINPLIYKKGLPDEKLTFEWYFSGNGIVPYIMDSTMTLCAYISAPPEAMAYKLRLTVKDEKGICVIKSFDVYVKSSLSEGLLVAETKDEANSDLSLIINRCFDGNLDKKVNKFYNNTYSQINNEPIPGLVKDFLASVYNGNRSLTIITDKSLIRADYSDMVKIPKECNEGMFIIAPKQLDEATFIVRERIWTEELMCVSGLLYPRGTQNNNRTYNFFRKPAEGPDYFVTKMFCPFNEYPYYSSVAFDEKNGKLLFFNTSTVFYAKEQPADALFDVNNLRDYDCLHIGSIATKKIHLLLRQKSSGNYFGFVITTCGNASLANYAEAKYDYSAADEIGSANYFATNINEEALYYATDTKLYTTALSVIAPRVQYEAKNGDKITDIMIWNSTGKIDCEDLKPGSETGITELTAKGRMILITTYNESTKEGKVTAIPIVNIGNGGLEPNPKFHHVYGGYGRILKIGKQEK